MVKKVISRDYILFLLITIFLFACSLAIFTYFSYISDKKNNSINLAREAKNINNIISELFDYSNRINSYIGEQISQYPNDQNFILRLFRDADKAQNKNSKILSWTSFDWVDENNFQTVNSKIGIRKDPPYMSDREYAKLSRTNPWKLILSKPTIGNPSKALVIPAGTGITDKQGKFLGIVAVGFNINELVDRIRQSIDKDVSFLIVDNLGNVIIKSSDNIENLSRLDINSLADSDFGEIRQRTISCFE